MNAFATESFDALGCSKADLVVGAPRWSNGTDKVGAAFVYFGSAGGISLIDPWQAEGEYAYYFFGYSVAGVGDANGDNFADIVIGAYGYDLVTPGTINPGDESGAAYGYYGSATGPSPAMNPDWFIRWDSKSLSNW